ncbi:hypothetical protein ABAC460_16655 [Asticcacaulis sp. AC460]|uniref:tetratricopeptide repeat protein n=1 Tax=Asticcacaulis sp. AC460 TaxID=1282360 RepID=UPI0003C3F267|nr:hypothetical protein [Asticcacaulis sp. AC460]ESQ88290.1 hypothetical protein ABAC460_16655 [Asticcacaulis sp. AC460]
MPGRFLLAATIAVCCWAAAGSVVASDTVVKPVPAPQIAPADLGERMAAVYKVMWEAPDDGVAALAAELDAIMKDPGFTSLTAKDHYLAHWMAAVLDQRMAKYESAYQHRLRMGEVYPEAKTEGDYWVYLAGAAVRTRRYDVAAEALVKMLEVDPAEAKDMSYPFLLSVVREAKKQDDKGPYRRLLMALWQAAYEPGEALSTAQFLWWQLFELHVADGKPDAARKVLAGLTDAHYVIRIRADKRYRAFVGDLPSSGDYSAAYRHERSKVRSKVAAHPDLIEGQTMLADYLMKERRYDEALAVMDAALSKVDAAPKDQPAFSDLDDHYQWAVEARANALRGLGRWNEVTEGKVKAKAAGTESDSVSQALNLGVYYVAIEKPEAALMEADAIAPDQVSGYGAMVAAEIRVCAYAQQGKVSERDQWLGYMKDHEVDGPGLYLEGLRCAGDFDALAKAVIAQLKDVETRSETLVDLQDYDEDPALTLQEKRMNAIDATVKARRDVRSAIARYGFVEAYSLKGIEP